MWKKVQQVMREREGELLRDQSNRIVSDRGKLFEKRNMVVERKLREINCNRKLGIIVLFQYTPFPKQSVII
jgi:hypothetical protein